MVQWRSIAAATAGFLAAGAKAQTGTLLDLGSLLESQKNLSTFNTLIQKYPEILLKLPSYDGVTVLAPSDDAFDKIPYSSLKDAFENNDEKTITNVLEYHILQGTRAAADLVPGAPVFIPTLLTDSAFTNVTGGQNVVNVEQAGDVVVFVSGQGSRSTVVQKDLRFTGGIVQVVDSLLIPPTKLQPTLEAFNLTSFEGAVFAGKDITSMSYTPNVTILAANNAAFQALGPAITDLSSDDLANVLDYVTLPKLVFSIDMKNGTKFVTKQGGNITITQVGNNIYINSAQLLQADNLIANGVLHILDNVLNPLGPNAKPNAQLATQVPIFASASSVGNLPFTSAIPCSTSCPVTTTAGSNPSSSAVVATTKGTHTSSFVPSSSKGAAMAKETGLRVAGVMAALGGAVLMI